MIIKPKNCVIVVAEGLDVSGKETFCKKLKSVLDTVYLSDFKYDENIHIVSHSFPSYETEIGQKIKAALDTPREKRIPLRKLNELFYLDRENWMKKFVDLANENPDEFYILVLDRYYFSTLFYSEKSPLKEGTNIISRSSFKSFIEEAHELPNPDVIALFYHKTKKSRIIHSKLVKEKLSKDCNETMDFQDTVNSVIKSTLTPKARELTYGNSELIKLGVGDTFNNNIHLLKICEIVENARRKYDNTKK